MWLSLKRIFRRVAIRPLFFTAECDKQELALWHNLADVSDYLQPLDKDAKDSKITDIFNALAEHHDWPVAEESSRVKLWLSGMFDGAHKFNPTSQFVKHTRFLARDKYDDDAVWPTGREFVLSNSEDIGLALQKIKP
jgi:hypothetical protein|tara:strand:- start:128996 stop:129406 length:411 start_codon:yes stop_codon:yes gene_type:complete